MKLLPVLIFVLSVSQVASASAQDGATTPAPSAPVAADTTVAAEPAATPGDGQPAEAEMAGATDGEAAASPTPDAGPPESVTAPEAAARSAALELAGAFANDGYKIRDGFWFSELGPDAAEVIEVNLFAGNEYWFCVAANEPTRVVDVTVFDDAGNLVDQQDYTDGARAAAGVVPVTSGKFYVRVRLIEGEKGSFGLVYCYK